MCQGCNTRAKIAFGVAVLLAIIGVVCIIVASAAADAVDVDFVVEGSQSFQIELTDDCVLDFLTEESEDCDAAGAGIDVRPADNSAWLASCSLYTYSWLEDFEDPPLQQVGQLWAFSSSDRGTYEVSSVAKIWVHNGCEVVEDAVTGVLAMLGLLIVAIILLIVSGVLCCVGCCCLGDEKHAPISPTPVLVGQPTSD